MLQQVTVDADDEYLHGAHISQSDGVGYGVRTYKPQIL